MARPAQVYAQVSDFFFIGKWPMGPTDPGRQHVLPAGAEHGERAPGAVVQRLLRLEPAALNHELLQREALPAGHAHKAEEVLLPPPGRGRPAEAAHGRPAQPGTQV